MTRLTPEAEAVLYEVQGTVADLVMLTAGKTVTERCLAPVRWEQNMGYGHKLQQLWEVITEQAGQPTERREEWRDVPYA